MASPAKEVRRDFPWALSTLFGLGGFSSMPGTVGSAVCCLIVMPVVSTPLLLFLIVLFSVLGVWGSGKYSRDRGLSDPSEVIVDEAVGVWISMLGHVTSVGASGYLLPALFLFRVFDILKPIPVSTAEKLPGGWGIMADDVVAGVLANLLLWAFRWIFIGDGFVRLFG